MLLRSGINSAYGVSNYLDWAIEHKVDSAVARQLFEPANNYSGHYSYGHIYEKEFVSALEIASRLDENSLFVNKRTLEDKIFYEYRGAKFELELRSCACQHSGPVIHPFYSDAKVSSWESFFSGEF